MNSLVWQLLLLLWLSPAPQTTNRLELEVIGAKTDNGKIQVLVFDSEQGYPDQVNLAIRSFSLPVKGGKSLLKIEDLKAGTYVICVIHDEDENGKLNTNAVGYPTEKYGFSNDAKGYFGPPSFSKAAFALSKEPKQIRIQLR